MRSSNGMAFGPSDYIHYIFNFGDFGSDVSECIAELFAPKIIIKDGIALVASIGSPDRFPHLLANSGDPYSAQYWSNMIGIMDVFNCSSMAVAEVIALAMTKAWVGALDMIEGGADQIVMTVRDEEPDELFLTIASKNYRSAQL